MNDVKRFLWPIIMAIPALLAGIAIGHYTSPTSRLPAPARRRTISYLRPGRREHSDYADGCSATSRADIHRD